MAEKPPYYPRQKWALFRQYQAADPTLNYKVWISWINDLCMDELRPLGYRRTQRSFTPLQLRTVLRLLGEPG